MREGKGSRFKKDGLVVLFLFYSFIFAGGEKVYLPAPTLLPHVERGMGRPGFWISIHPFPDRVILDGKGIERFNSYIREDLSFTREILALEPYFDGKELKRKLKKNLASFQKRRFYFRNGEVVPPSFYREMEKYMGINGIPERIKVRFGVVVKYADERILPTYLGLYREKGDEIFDRLQVSALDIGTPVAILHKTQDARWFYVLSPLDEGWVESVKIGVGRREEVEEFLKKPFVVVIRAKADVFLNMAMTSYWDYIRMGGRLPFKRVDDEKVEVMLPYRGDGGLLLFRRGFLRRKDVHVGYLPYTPRVIIEEAFELLNCPYGWGGMCGEQDCSRFIQMVFATVGILLPRNSSAQAKTGFLLREFTVEDSLEEKLKVIVEKGVGGITLLHIPGHIMLYLGSVEGRPYVIHSLWAYREGDKLREVKRVVVSDLLLGEKSLLKRVDSVRIIILP